MKNSKEKLEWQREMVVGQLTWAAENLFFAYHTMESQLQSLLANKELLELQLAIARLQESFGMVKKSDVTALENNVMELTNAVSTLERQMQNLKRDLNLLFGKAHDAPMLIKPLSAETQVNLEEVKWKEDLQGVIEDNYSLRVARYDAAQKRDNATGLKYQDDKAKLELSFYKAYQDLETAAKNLESERTKLILEEEKYAHATLRYELGMTSRVQYMTDTNTYTAQQRKVRDSELEYLKAARKYQWFINGLTL